ncbi:MAG: hypothetical protein FWF15_07970 [Oscillospiraceae bacterium]|nr:hypothetical protein [Oscillospiraceae bacterium]
MKGNQVEIIENNLADISRQQASLRERRLAHICDRAKYLGGQFSDKLFFTSDAFREIYNEVNSTIFAEDVPEFNVKATTDLMNETDNFDKIYLCRKLIELYSDLDINLIFGGGEKNDRIAYLRNSYTDTAYEIFSREIEDATVTYCADFNAVCEDVYYSRSGMCILPTENSTDGNLMRFRNLIKKYDLKIVMTCAVEAAQESVTKFALLKKNVEYIKMKKKHPLYFEISAVTENLRRLLSAAENYGFKLYKIDSVPISYSESEYSYDIIFSSDNGELFPFICYLFLELPQFNPMGIYTHL